MARTTGMVLICRNGAYMAACEYGQIVGGTCGSSMDNSANIKSFILAKCTKSTQGHLCYCNV